MTILGRLTTDQRAIIARQYDARPAAVTAAYDWLRNSSGHEGYAIFADAPMMPEAVGAACDLANEGIIDEEPDEGGAAAAAFDDAINRHSHPHEDVAPAATGDAEEAHQGVHEVARPNVLVDVEPPRAPYLMQIR